MHFYIKVYVYIPNRGMFPKNKNIPDKLSDDKEGKRI